MSEPKKVVVVLGAGVNGLTAALFLLEAGYAVKIVAKHLPGDLDPNYPSEIAASTWASDTAKTDEEDREWYRDSYKTWLDLSNEGHDHMNIAVISRRTYYSYQDKPGPEVLEKGADAYWYRDFVDGFTVIPANKLPPGVKWGTTITSFAIDAPKYLTYLQDRILNLGGTITRATLPAGEGLVGMLKASQDVLKPSTQSVYAYVNATGLGAYALLGDEKMFPLRTQTVHIKGESANIVDRLEDGNLISYENPISGAVPITYVTPRVGQGFTVLGGYMQTDNWNEKIDPAITERFLELGKFLAPELLNEKGELTVVSVQVGLGPHRRGGIRLEVEKVHGVDESRDVPVVHNYGHSHGGFIKSIGSAKKVVRLVNDLR